MGMTDTRMSTSLFVNADLDAAVLRQAFLGDVEMAENLHARNDGRLEPLELRGHGHLLQHAVNAVADAEFVLERLEVDVRRAQFDGVGQDLVDEPDDRGVLGGVVEVGILLAVLVHDLERRLLVQGVNGVGADAQVFLHLALDGFGGREHGLDLQAGKGLEGVQALGGEEPAGGDFHGAVDALKGKQFFLEENAGREEREQFPVRLHVFERREADGVFPGEPLEER